MSILHEPGIRRDSIPFLFQRFVLILRVYILHLGKDYPYFESLHSTFWKRLLSSISACVFILCYADFTLNQASCHLSNCLALFFVLLAKLYCDIIKATQLNLEHKEARHLGMHEALLALQAV